MLRRGLQGMIWVSLLSGCTREGGGPSFLSTSPSSRWEALGSETLVSSHLFSSEIVVPPKDRSMSPEELIDIALHNNPSTRKSWAIVKGGSAQYGIAKAPLWPSLTVEGSFQREKETYSFQGEGVYLSTQTGPDVTLSYTLLDFGKQKAAADAALCALYQQDYLYNRQIEDVVQEVRGDLYEYLFQKAQLQARELDVSNAQISLEAAQEKSRAGLSSLSDLAQARTQWLLAKIELNDQRMSVERSKAKLHFDMGLPSHILFEVEPLPEVTSIDFMLEPLERLVEKAQGQRQDFLAEQAAFRSHSHRVSEKEKAFLPELKSTLGAGHYWFNQGEQERGCQWQAGLSLSFPLFDGGERKNRVLLAKADREAAGADLLQKELSVIREVTLAYREVEISGHNLVDTREYFESAQVEFEAALASYRAGTVSILDLLTAQSALSDARVKKAKGQRDWYMALSQLSYAVGSFPLEMGEIACKN